MNDGTLYPDPACLNGTAVNQPLDEAVKLPPRLMSEKEAAKRLEISPDTLRRLRFRRLIGYYDMGRPRYTEKNLSDYLSHIEVLPCQNESSKLENTGLASGQTALAGAAHGSMPKHDRRAEHHSALMTLKPQKKR